jgi:cell division protein FtsL
VEAASYKTPERVEIIARTLLGMEPPPPERIVPLPKQPAQGDTDGVASTGGEGPP